jgi:hypothetical protein
MATDQTARVGWRLQCVQSGYRHYRILRLGLDAYRRLFSELATVHDERDRILRSLET